MRASELIFKRLSPGQWTVDTILDVVPMATEIWFHGSRAIGKHKRTSDTDILVVVPDEYIGESYLKILRILQKLSSQYKGYDIQPTHADTNIHRIAQEEGKLLYKKQVINEVPLPSDWDPQKMDRQQTFKDRLKYALERARRIGGGSSRVAMIIEYQGRDTVLKVAKNKKGLAQNAAEIEILTDGYSGRLPIVIPLIDFDRANGSQHVWLQTELAKKVQAPTLMKLLHTPSMWLFMNQVRNLAGNQGRYDMGEDKIKQVYFTQTIGWQPTEQGWDIFQTYASELADLATSTTIELGDFSNPANWGIYRNRPVVLDLGFTEDTATLYRR